MTKRISLLLGISLTLCACPGDSDNPSESGGRGGTSGQGSAGKAGPSTACVYVESSTMYCPDAGLSDHPTEEKKCRDNSTCDLAAEEFIASGCKFSTLYLSQHLFQGTCADYERADAEGETPLGGGTCEVSGKPSCVACAKQNCCEQLKACNDTSNAMGLFFCRKGCQQYVTTYQVFDGCLKDCYRFGRLEPAGAVDGVRYCLEESCEDAC